MKTKHLLKLIIVLTILSSCSSVKTTSDYDKSVNLSDYKTFGFTKESKELPTNDLVKNRILNAISSNLKSKGLTESDNPDMLVDLGLKTKEKTDYQSTNYDMGGYYGRRWRVGTSIGTTNTREINYTEGTLVINLVDAKKDQLLWMGSGTSVVSDKSVKEENITAGINKILSSFPSLK
ncbi:DUF4136 domain-containing protein [Paucihalobacter ruber]|uniref:DUF4136 domain-containing protein n=1 Tax=Paucihalobacter ruber TaxID=2567861 RepID=A0A506PEE4_9FLAO|nr:DUF4136 domain-containing protein [Paucihalobacter ruber]TPV31437.1 DUF4136 domain-containing protein [Paucihalobacter ruber]